MATIAEVELQDHKPYSSLDRTQHFAEDATINEKKAHCRVSDCTDTTLGTRLLTSG